MSRAVRLRLVLWRLLWPWREARARWRRARGTSRLDVAAIAHELDVPPWMITGRGTYRSIAACSASASGDILPAKASDESEAP